VTRSPLIHVVGARPNFIKAAPVISALAARGITQVLVHTGQHYDDALSSSFFRDLGIPEPDFNLEVGSLSHAAQTARIMERFEPVLIEQAPDWVVVYGDVNSTAAAAMVASKLSTRIAHVEAGLRSYDRSMPEEINRLITDRLADLLLAPSRDAVENLKREGEPACEIEFVGNVMIDTLHHSLEVARGTGFRKSLGVGRDAVVVTLHRPSNVDDPERLRAVVQALRVIATTRPVVFAVHPRTAERVKASGISLGDIRVLPPVRYVEMLDLVEGAFAVITDSGGLQEETTALGVPCFTVRENTERPITVELGTNVVVGTDTVRIITAAAAALNGSAKTAARRPPLWDGNASERILAALLHPDALA